MIDLLESGNIPVIWALKPVAGADGSRMSAIDLLKDLVGQVMCLQAQAITERSLSVTCARLRAAETEQEWLDILASVLASMPKIVTILDLAAIHPQSVQVNENFFWVDQFQRAFQALRDRGARTTFKVLIVGYGHTLAKLSRDSNLDDCMINIGTSGLSALSRKKPAKWQRASLGQRTARF